MHRVVTINMRILVDADACPVKKEIAEVAGEYAIPVTLVFSVSHHQQSTGAEIVQVDNTPEAADMAIINRLRRTDIVITQDYGLASLVLAKGARCICPRGMIYDDDNIDQLLLTRHISAKARQAGNRTKGPKAFSSSDRRQFTINLQQLIESDY